MEKELFIESKSEKFQLTLALPSHFDNDYISKPTLLFQEVLKDKKTKEYFNEEHCRIELTKEQCDILPSLK